MIRLSIFVWQLVRNPPSLRMADFMLAVLAIVLAMLAVEHLGCWPASWQVTAPHNRPGIGRL